MNSKKNSTVDSNDDLNFIPLDLSEPFKSKDSSWVPFINIDAETETMTNNFFIGLPNLQTNNGFTPLPSINTTPILPYPSTVPIISTSGPNSSLNIPPKNTNNIIDENELYPSETLEDELYSYNTNTPRDNSFENELLHLDILREFDLSIGSDIINSTRGINDIDRIFNNIKENDGGLLGALKAYNIPYPIASSIIKKTIKSAITNL